MAISDYRKAHILVDMVDVLPDNEKDAVEVVACLVAHVALAIDCFNIEEFVELIKQEMVAIKRKDN